MAKVFTVTLELELTYKDIMRIRQNSIERVLNNAIFIGGEVEHSKNPDLSERGSILWQDCEELKPTVDKLWNRTRNALFNLDINA